MSLITSLIPSLKTDAAAEAKTVSPTKAVPTVAPRYEVTETPEAYGAVVELPGVAKEGLELSVDHQVVRVLGRRGWRQPEGWTALHRESRAADFELALEHGRVIDPGKIHAELRDGVLRISLPKADALKPRRITVA